MIVSGDREGDPDIHKHVSLTVVLICISARIVTSSIFSWIYWLSAYILRKNVYSDPLVIFIWVTCFLLLSFESSFSDIDTKPLSDV